MVRLAGPTGRLILLVASLLLVGLLGCASPTVPPSGQSDDLAALRAQVVAQSTRIAALETRVALPQLAATPRPAAPTATVAPAIAGIPVDGATKGLATAKVTITEYLDYL